MQISRESVATSEPGELFTASRDDANLSKFVNVLVVFMLAIRVTRDFVFYSFSVLVLNNICVGISVFVVYGCGGGGTELT